MRSAIILLSCLALNACGNVVPSTLMALRGISPLAADPEGFVLRLDLPDGVRVQPGSARLVLEAERADIPARRSGSFVLMETVGERGATYQVAPSDLAALRRLQSEINKWETDAPEATSGSLRVSLTACRTGSDLPADAPVSVDLQMGVDAPFVPLLREAPLQSILDQAETTGLEACP